MANNNEEITSVRSGPLPAEAGGQNTMHGAALEPGIRVGNFSIEAVLGIGGFGIVYRAVQDITGRLVAIKEFFPSTMLDRVNSHAVRLRAEKDEELFSLGMRCFVKEAMLLSELNHPGLVQVLHFWEENGTAYMVMPFYEGDPLSRLLPDLTPADSAKLIRSLLDGLLPALSYLHERQIYHRDISPDNVFILKNGQPMLLDFGAARRIVDKSESVTVILKAGYAPIEQYDESGRQGAWTDIYALSALLYKLITGHAPPASAVRICHDEVAPLLQTHAGQYPRNILHAIDVGLAVRTEDRPPSIAAWKKYLEMPEDAVRPDGPDAKPDAVLLLRPPSSASRRRLPWLLALLTVAGAAAGWFYYQPASQSRLVEMQSRQLLAELDKVLPTLIKSQQEADSSIDYYREKIRLSRDPLASAGLRQSLLKAEETRAVAAEAMALYTDKFKKELPAAKKRLGMAESARLQGSPEEAELLLQSASQQLSRLKDWNDDQVKLFAGRRLALVQSLNGVWAVTDCAKDAATWILNGNSLHISGGEGAAKRTSTETVVAAYDGKVFTLPAAADAALPNGGLTEYRLVKEKLVRMQGGKKQALRACE